MDWQSSILTIRPLRSYIFGSVFWLFLVLSIVKNSDLNEDVLSGTFNCWLFKWFHIFIGGSTCKLYEHFPPLIALSQPFRSLIIESPIIVHTFAPLEIGISVVFVCLCYYWAFAVLLLWWYCDGIRTSYLFDFETPLLSLFDFHFSWLPYFLGS